jgi:hypothetical protein
MASQYGQSAEPAGQKGEPGLGCLLDIVRLSVYVRQTKVLLGHNTCLTVHGLKALFAGFTKPYLPAPF